MSQTIASADVLIDEWNHLGPVEYRIHASAEWISATGEVCEMGSPYDLEFIDNTYRKGDCTVADQTVTLPTISLERTDNLLFPPSGVSLTLSLFDKDKSRCLVVLIPSFSVNSSANSLDDLIN